jgi:small subunit ribosomal protein S17
MAKKKDNDTPATPDDADRSEIDEQSPEADAPAVDTEAEASESPESEGSDAPDAQAPAVGTPEADAPAEDAPAVEHAEEPAAEEPATEEPAAEEPAAEETAAEEGEAATAAAEAPARAPEDELSPKERRRAERSKHTGEARPQRSAEERHAGRLAERRAKAARRRARRLQERTKAAERRAAAPAPQPLAPVHAPVEGRRRVRQGIVVSDKAAKTITVRIDVARRHRRYEKIVRSSSTLHAHDENNDAHEGDVVRVIESRPLSRSKRWALVDVLERAR